MSYPIKQILHSFAILILTTLNFTLKAQEIIWATKIEKAENIEKEYENNHISMILGPPAVYPSSDFEQNAIDMYADGYIIHPSGNRKEQLDLSFEKSAFIANQICIAGIFNHGTIRKAYVKRKDNAWVQVYNFEKEKSDKKYHSIIKKFPLETVYGIRLIIDHTYVNYWNLIKGIGICNSSDSIQIKPDLYEEGTTFGEKKKLSESVNSPKCTELNPRMGIDGSVLYFTRDCDDKNLQEIFYAPANGSDWTEAVNMGKPLNNTANNYISSTTYDPKTLFVGNIYKANGDFLEDGLSKTVRDKEEKWSIPEKIALPPIEGKDIISHFVTADKSAIILVAEDKINKSNSDLYVSLFNKYKNDWEQPFSLGNEINSEIVEDFPYMAMDGKTLFFCSNGRLGYGGFDIYVSKKLDNSWGKWSKPLNLGPNVNSKTDDLTFSVSTSGDIGYFSTYSIDKEPHNIDIYQTKLPASLIQPSLVSFKAKVVSERTNEAINATVKLSEMGTKGEPIELSNDGMGVFSQVLFSGKDYLVDIAAAEFFKRKDTLKFDNSKGNATLVKNYTLKPFLDSGQVTVINNIRFEYNSHVLNEISHPYLDQIAKQLQEQRKAIVEIAGHTDNVGSDSFNLILSEARAKSVVEYLTSKGIRPWRMKAVGYGKSMPIAPNDTEEGRTLNRRVEMTILENDFTKKYVNKTTIKGKRKKSNLISKNKYKK
jgi:OmpA-OmpF porin, OOP family